MKRIPHAAALSFYFLATATAFAADGYITGDVNLRAGPDPSYPSVADLSAGTTVAIEGCVDGWSWCDVATGDSRGWVAGESLQEEYQGQRVLVPEYGVRIGIPVVSFVFATYWQSNYRNRPWYGDRERWSHVTPQYRPQGVAGSRGNGNEGVHGRAPSVTPTDSRNHVANAVPRQNAAAPTPPSYQAKPVTAVRPQNAVATQTRPAEHARPTENETAHAKPADRNAAVPRAAAPSVAASKALAAEPKTAPATAPRTAVPNKVSEQKPPHPEKSDKAPPERDAGKDKDQH
jgi:uncharacterized protein YraI